MMGQALRPVSSPGQNVDVPSRSEVQSMRTRSILIAGVAIAMLALPALASMGGGDKPEPPPQPQPNMLPSGTSSNASSPTRQEAEGIYSVAYEEVAKAKKDLADGKTKNAEKKFRRALDRGERATALDTTYHEAWNLVGFCARKLGNYDKAFAAYDKCLSLAPDYAPAHEYLGEAWLEKNEPGKAREQLALLEGEGAAEDAKTLSQAIVAYDAAHPAAAAPAESAPAAAPDSSGSGGNR